MKEGGRHLKEGDGGLSLLELFEDFQRRIEVVDVLGVVNEAAGLSSGRREGSKCVCVCVRVNVRLRKSVRETRQQDVHLSDEELSQEDLRFLLRRLANLFLSTKQS